MNMPNTRSLNRGGHHPAAVRGLAIAAIALLSATANAAGEASPAMFDKTAGAVRIPEGERLRILQLTDTQIIDSSQRRSPNRLSPSEIKKWLPENAEANEHRSRGGGRQPVIPRVLREIRDGSHVERKEGQARFPYSQKRSADAGSDPRLAAWQMP